MADQIPPPLPLPKGGIPLFAKEGLGEIGHGLVWSIMESLGKEGKELGMRVPARL
jgi:hypothetical protein